VRLQAEAGIDVVSDGEYGKSVNWAFYVHRRLSGLTWRPYTAEEAKDPTIAVIGGRDREAFPESIANTTPASSPMPVPRAGRSLLAQ
jgi:5-methyltetrahydropteroyltriglutamate--homocysteine methyltransferase